MAAGCGAGVEAVGGKVENDLTKAERDALVVGGTVRGEPARGVMALCKKLATDHARQVRAERGRTFDRDDLEADALTAAVEAARYFDPARGAKFSTYAAAFVRQALLTATDERHKPPVWRKLPDKAAVVMADRDENEPDELDHFEYLTPDQRAAFDLVTDGRQKEVLLLVIRGFTVHQIEQQTGMPPKDVRLCYRNVVDILRRAGLVPADADPYPAAAAKQAAEWERQKPKNLADARRREELDAKRALLTERDEYRRGLADRLHPLLADPRYARATVKELAAALGRPDLAAEVKETIAAFKLRPRWKKVAGADTEPTADPDTPAAVADRADAAPAAAVAVA